MTGGGPPRPSAPAPRRSSRPPEAARDILESDFTAVLRRVWEADRAVLASAFVDYEGECIDYCSSIDPFDAKIAGAYLQVVVDGLIASYKRAGLGRVYALEIGGSERDFYVRAVSEETSLIVVTRAGMASTGLFASMERAVRHLRKHTGLPAPPWEPVASLAVEVRRAVGWAYAPAAFLDGDERVVIADVLGRWVEDATVECFRVRTGSGRELTLEHETETGHWEIAPESGEEPRRSTRPPAPAVR